jgi:hypothetical protein
MYTLKDILFFLVLLPPWPVPLRVLCSPNFTVAGSTKWNVLLQLKVCARHKRRHACAVHEPAHTRASIKRSLRTLY